MVLSTVWAAFLPRTLFPTGGGLLVFLLLLLQTTSSLLNGFIFAYCLTFGLAFLVATFAILPLKERANGAKHSQFTSGLSAATYWLTSFFWDLINFSLPALCIIGIIKAFDIDAYVADIQIWFWIY